MVKRLPPARAALPKQKLYALCCQDHKAAPRLFLLAVWFFAQLLSACVPAPLPVLQAAVFTDSTPLGVSSTPAVTPLPTRPVYQPGQLVDYIAQSGDTLPALAYRFNTTEKEIRAANPIIPAVVTSMPPGMPMKIPIYYQPFWGSPYEIIPDSLFINGPAQRGFNTTAFINSQPGWLKSYRFFTGENTQAAGELIDQIATDYSISPRLLLALIEYQTGALSLPNPPDPEVDFPLGYKDYNHFGLYRQLLWAANTLNDGYYRWREGMVKEFDLRSGRQQRLDPWINAATASLQLYFGQLYNAELFNQAVHGEGFSAVYARLFGDPWANPQPHIPVNLTQPAMRFPFAPGHTWAYTGGPHTGWGSAEPFSAVDFAPPTVAGGCSATSEFATAVADGIIVRSGPAIAVLDLDGDGDERTGWVVFYLHLAEEGKASAGATLRAGDPIGHPSCEGGRATGTHVHIARKYNGEWIAADGAFAFNLEGWVIARGSQVYEGTITNGIRTARACTCGDRDSHVTAGP